LDFLTTKQIAEIWGISANRITILCKEGRIPGAYKIGKQWMLPEDAKKPTDGRTSEAKTETQAHYIRLPFFMNMPADRFVPALSEEEMELRTAQLLFLACDFSNAERKFERIARHGKDKYLKICSLFFLCYISAEYNSGKYFNEYYTQLSIDLSEEFEHKTDMKLLRPLILCLLSLYGEAKEVHRYDPEYDYSPSFYPVMYILSLLCGPEPKGQQQIEKTLKVYEVIASQLEDDGHIYEAQLLHIFLLIIYNMIINNKMMYHHLRKALSIAYDNDFLHPLASIYAYYTDAFKEVLKDYPESFAGKIRKYGKLIHKSFSAYTENHEEIGIYSLLSEKDYQYVRYALQGYSNKIIAEALNTSERTVAAHFSAIFAKLGIKKKSEIASLFSSTI